MTIRVCRPTPNTLFGKRCTRSLSAISTHRIPGKGRSSLAWHSWHRLLLLAQRQFGISAWPFLQCSHQFV